MSLNPCQILISVIIFSFSNLALSWGEKGHNLITIAAVELLKEKVNNDPKLITPFQNKAEMLGHLSNIPDIYWRGLDKKITSVGNPAHYIDWEYINKKPSFKTIPLDPKKVQKIYEKACNKNNPAQDCPPIKKRKKEFQYTAGYNPWRVQQLWHAATESLSQVKKSNSKDRNKYIDTALLNLGILSHFIEDLSNPLHNSADYDGWDKGQGKIHRYFEEDIISEISLSLVNEVFEKALKENPIKKIMKTIPTQHKKLPLALALAVSFDSYGKISELLEIDRKHSLLLASSISSGKKIKAKRKPAREMVKFYKPFAIQQLAIAADALSELWLWSIQKSGSPDLSQYHSYNYYLSPDFIPPKF